MKIVMLLITLISSFTLTSCATLKSNAFIGAALGATAGSIGGAVIGSPHNSVSGALIGTATGAAVGALIGYLTEPKTNKRVDVTDMSHVHVEGDQPFVTSPEVRQFWVPDKIDGNKYIKGHYMFVIERGSVWTMQ